MTRRSIIKSAIEEQLAVANSGHSFVEPQQSRSLAGPVRTMGLTLDKMEDEAKALQSALATGEKVLELDAYQIDPSFVSDRFDAGDDDAFVALKASLRQYGQEVPVLVRPSPIADGRYQLAYGHRRWRAAKELGLPVRAVIKRIDDEALVLAQGLENSARRDLSYIERSMFAKTLEDRGLDRSVVMAALSTDKTELSKMISVARSIPELLARKIGPASKAGRRRWMQLADLLREAGAVQRAERILADPDLSKDSDVRFIRLLAELVGTKQRPSAHLVWTSLDGLGRAEMIRDAKATSLRFSDALPAEFVSFVAAKLDMLFADFQQKKHG